MVVTRVLPLALLIVLGSAAGAQSSDADTAAIRASILRGARGFETGNPDLILEHYGRDIVLSYPGMPDQDYSTLAKAYAELRNRPASVKASTTPTFDEILVAGDIAIVRLRWTTTIREGTRTSTRRLKDMQIWRREPDGRWMFVRGMHYREPEPAPSPASTP
ncbi:MAG TPA: nuclear transport factor 2 family protein [Gemmatimonadaceae bacterium]|nr:nuclear transport factor 2 family protein [Gemmatimonadaceae bacterium]